MSEEGPFIVVVRGDKADLCIGDMIIRDSVNPSWAHELASMSNASLKEQGFVGPETAKALRDRCDKMYFACQEYDAEKAGLEKERDAFKALVDCGETDSFCTLQSNAANFCRKHIQEFNEFHAALRLKEIEEMKADSERLAVALKKVVEYGWYDASRPGAGACITCDANMADWARGKHEDRCPFYIAHEAISTPSDGEKV